MTYSDYTQFRVLEAFGLDYDASCFLFSGVAPREPSPLLVDTLSVNAPIAFALNSEKARSELVITPLLIEVHRASKGVVKMFSGNVFNVDSSVGLAGYFDFILARSRFQNIIESPVLTVVEAKKENVPAGYGQCIATMVAAQRFNETNGEPRETIYGAVTTGDIWKFLSLTGTEVRVDRETYYLNKLEELLGVLWYTTQ